MTWMQCDISLVQLIACYLFGACQFLNQRWHIIDWAPWNKCQWNFNKNTVIFIQENIPEIVFGQLLMKISAHISQTCWPLFILLYHYSWSLLEYYFFPNMSKSNQANLAKKIQNLCHFIIYSTFLLLLKIIVSISEIEFSCLWFHDTIMTWKCFPHYWPFVGRFYQWLVDYPWNRPVMWSFGISFVGQNKIGLIYLMGEKPQDIRAIEFGLHWFHAQNVISKLVALNLIT